VRERVLDRQRVQVVVLLELTQLRLARLEQSDPDEFGAIGCTADRLIERDRTDPLAIAIETAAMMLIEAAYPKRLGTPQRRRIEAEETSSAPEDSMTSSSHFADAPRRPSSRVTRAGRCVWLRHHALRPELFQQEPSGLRGGVSWSGSTRDQTTTATIGAGPATTPAGTPAACFDLVGH
jgi:hypothetical protein